MKCLLITLTALSIGCGSCSSSNPVSSQPQEAKLTFKSRAKSDNLVVKELPELGSNIEQLSFKAEDAKAVLDDKPRPTSPLPLAVLAGNPPPDVDVCNLPFSALTKAIFENCAEQGISYIQLANTFGFAGDLTTETGNNKIYTWKNSSGMATITFTNDKLTSKTQVGLK